MALPDTYQEVEYIETTGTQFINTGLYVGNNIQVETKIAVNSISQPQIVFACYRTSGSDDLPNYYGLAAYQNRWYYGLNGSELNGGAYSPTIGTEYKIVYNNANNYININGSDVLNCSGTAGYTGTTLGIAVRANRNLSGSFKYYYFRMYNKATGAYERDFVPCYRKSDKKPGLYDLVNNTFYTNQGTGEFTYKEYAESGKITHRYIGTKQVRPGYIYKYSYTFKGKTVAEITSEWTSTVGGVAVNSDGVTGPGIDNDCSIVVPIPSLATAKTVIISGTVVANDSTRNAGYLGIRTGTGWGTGAAGYQVYGSNFNGMKVAYVGGGTDYFGNKVGDSVGGNTYKPTVTIDLENKIITGVLSGFNNSTLVLTDTQINHIRQFEHLTVYTASNWSTISDVSITIE